METFVTRLRRRTEELGMSHAEVARRIHLDQRRYGNYATGRNEPSFELLIKIAEILNTTPNELLGVDPMPKKKGTRDKLLGRLLSTAKAMTDDDLIAAVVQAEAVVKLRTK